MTQKHYDLSCLLAGDLSQEDAETTFQGLVSFVQDQGAILDRQTSPQILDLAYTIEKRDTAYLATVLFLAKPEVIKAIDAHLSEQENVLRHLLFIKPVVRKKVLAARSKPTEETPEKEEKKKIELADVEKKLDELLGA